MTFFKMNLIFLVLFSVLDLKSQDAPGESRVIEKLGLLGGKFERDENQPDHPVVGVSLAGSQRFSDNFAPLLRDLKHLSKLDLSTTRMTDEGLKEIGAIATLTTLRLDTTQISNEGLKVLKNLKLLRSLSSPQLLD